MGYFKKQMLEEQESDQSYMEWLASELELEVNELMKMSVEKIQELQADRELQRKLEKDD